MAAKTVALALLLVLLVSTAQLGMGARRRMELYKPDPADMLSYHAGAVLRGNIPVTILWYGEFTPAQKSIIFDFMLSLSLAPYAAAPSVAQWWNTIDELYLSKAAHTNSINVQSTKTKVVIENQESDGKCSMGKSLTLAQVSALAAQAKPTKGGIAMVFTAQDVTVEGFGMSRCGLHGSFATSATTYIWVGNPATQCPGECAWPFHQPIYGPQGAPLVAPNGDVGMDGMVMNLASMLAGTATNPFGDGYYQGSRDAPLEAAKACPGVFGSGAYPGFAGELKADEATGASYNANGANGRKYLLPALYDPSTARCNTLV
ncbi:hypothetical protein GUJ93_ZPchr0002g25327 [Zizania palustris]|uniref:Phi-1-like phosphate-induced protein n=1 Tax=Zizania palustris TaxID=103762 RepID=A0A8J5S6J7_ZIZPA|nr:hypothetical protein GUJ93_ZPchr0002g25327 [Zizania palustris]